MKNNLFLIFLPVFLISYIVIGANYPYYSAWDSSVVYAIDSLIVGSNQPPDHLFHPNSIPLIFNRYIFLPTAKFLGIIQISSMKELLNHSNPYLPFVETTNFLINIGYLYIIIFLITVYRIYSKILATTIGYFRGLQNIILVVLIILVSLTWGNLPYFIFWIRYESIGLVFWVLALYCIIQAAESPTQIRFFIISGVFSGFSILSKIQFLAGVCVFPLLFCSLINWHSISSKKNESRYLVILASLIFIGISLIHYLSYTSFVQKSIISAAFVDTLSSHNFAPIFPIITFCYLSFVIYLLFIKTKAITLAIPYLFRFTLFLTGIVSPLLLSLLLGTSYKERTGALYLTYIYSFMFGQKSAGYTSHPAFISLLPLLIPVIFLFFILVYPKFKTIFLQNFQNRISISFSLGTLFFLQIAIALILRPDAAKDGMIKDLWIGLSVVITWRIFATLIPAKKIFYMIGFSATLLFSYQLHSLLNYHKLNYDYTSRQADYYYSTPMWKAFSYGYRSEQYRTLIQRSYPTAESWQYVFQWSQQLAALKLLLNQVFRSSSFSLSNSSIAFKSSILFNKESIVTISASLNGAMLVPYTSPVLNITPRADYDFYLISPDDSISTDHASLTNLTFEIQGLSQIKKFSIYKIGPGTLNLQLSKGISWIAIKNKTLF